ncbi:hypothetical protein ABZX85_49910, partial [Streptomyces sp. NPDC004539]|uniref:hypothetical protein n=1 Tax=Streptomyces sp. NPDC004539 TaxID=3154280 RepID=UPI0033AD527D
DVSCSVVRRVALPDAFFALDGLLETFLPARPAIEDEALRADPRPGVQGAEPPGWGGRGGAPSGWDG